MTLGLPRVGSFVVAAMLVCCVAPARGQDRTDVVTLLNGDRITGEIVDLDRGRLQIETDDIGTIEIEWDNVATVRASGQFETVMSDGRRFLGSLQPAGERVIVIVGSVGETSMPIQEVTLIRPIGRSFWAQVDGSIDAGFTYTRSSGIAQTSLNSTTVFRRPAFRLQLTGSATLTQRNDGTEPDDRAAMELSYVRYRGRRLFVAGAGRLETNESLGLLLRSQVGGVVGQRLVRTNRALVELGGGAVVNREQGVDTEPTANFEGLVTFVASFYSYDRPKTEVDVNVQYYPGLSDWGRQRLQVDAGIKRDLWKDLSFGIDVFDTFDSAPPNPDAARNDVGVVTSVSWSY